MILRRIGLKIVGKDGVTLPDYCKFCKCFSSLRFNSQYLWLSILLLFIAACDGGGGSSSASPASNDSSAFINPELVTVIGYSGDAMEPFISRDGAYLFFNDFGPDKDIFYATYVDDTTFQFMGAITSINTSAVDGVPTMDTASTFYYVSVANYDPPISFDTLYMGTWNGSTVTGSTPVTGLALNIAGFVNFDVDVSPDGLTLYFNDGDFRGGNNFPDAADIAIAFDSGSGFVRASSSAIIMANVNTANLEYAPAISTDGLELFFTRFDLNTTEVGIYRAARANTNSPFGEPQLVSAIDGFIEGPALSPDEKSLYYHKMNTTTGMFELYRVTRQ